MSKAKVLAKGNPTWGLIQRNYTATAVRTLDTWRMFYEDGSSQSIPNFNAKTQALWDNAQSQGFHIIDQAVRTDIRKQFDQLPDFLAARVGKVERITSVGSAVAREYVVEGTRGSFVLTLAEVYNKEKLAWEVEPLLKDKVS